MINRVSFMGREEMLIKVGQKAKNTGEEFVSESKIFSKEEMNAMNKRVKKVYQKPETKIEYKYISPYEPIKNNGNMQEVYKPQINPHDFDILG